MLARRSSARGRAEALAHSAPVFAALGDGTRLRLVARLGAEGPLSMARLTDGTRVTRQAVAKHLRVLAEAGLARGLRRGRERLWQLEAAPLDAARRSLERMARRWDEALGRLKAAVEEEPLSPDGTMAGWQGRGPRR